MELLTRWILPIAFGAVGIAIFAGWIIPVLPNNAGLRIMLGLVAILLGVHRFVASRTMTKQDRRRYGGERNRPWEP